LHFCLDEARAIKLHGADTSIPEDFSAALSMLSSVANHVFVERWTHTE
jgi:hypothetical protein